MTDNHTELCERLRQASTQCSDCGMYETSSDFDLAVSMIESQAARIQKQALEYVSLQAQCDEHLTRVSRLEILLDSERATNKALSDENAILADLQPQELLARVAELEKERDALKVDAQTWRILLAMLIHEIDKGQRRGPYKGIENAPLHGHAKVGIWDSDNGALSGTQCAWCAVWNEARAALQAEKETRS